MALLELLVDIFIWILNWMRLVDCFMPHLLVAWLTLLEDLVCLLKVKKSVEIGKCSHFQFKK